MSENKNEVKNNGLVATVKKCKYSSFIAAVLVSVIVALVAFCGANSTKSVAKRYVKNYYAGKGAEAVSCIPEDYIRYEAEYEGISVKEAKCILNEQIENEATFTGAEYGKYKVKVSINNVESLGKDDFNELKENLKDKYGIKISAAKNVTVEYTIKGKNKTETFTEVTRMVKIGLSWKVMAGF